MWTGPHERQQGIQGLNHVARAKIVSQFQCAGAFLNLNHLLNHVEKKTTSSNLVWASVPAVALPSKSTKIVKTQKFTISMLVSASTYTSSMRARGSMSNLIHDTREPNPDGLACLMFFHRNVTGSSAPITPVDKEAYKEHVGFRFPRCCLRATNRVSAFFLGQSIPWFSLYDEPEPAKNLGAGFSTIKSVNEIDAEDDAAIVERVEGPEEGESKDNDSDEALFGGRWKEGNDGTVIDIDASKLSTIRRVGTLLSGSIRRPSRWNRSCVAPGNSDHVHPTKPVPNSWTFESDNVSRLTR